MNTPSASSEYLHIVYRADLEVLVGRWMRQISTADLRAGYQDLLEAAAHYGCRQWLIDGRRRNRSHADDAQWMMDEYFPQLAAQLGNGVSLAYLFTPTHLLELEADTLLPPLSYFEERPYQVQRFIEEQMAMRWLALEQHRLALVG